MKNWIEIWNIRATEWFIEIQTWNRYSWALVLDIIMRIRLYSLCIDSNWSEFSFHWLSVDPWLNILQVHYSSPTCSNISYQGEAWELSLHKFWTLIHLNSRIALQHLHFGDVTRRYNVMKSLQKPLILQIQINLWFWRGGCHTWPWRGGCQIESSIFKSDLLKSDPLLEILQSIWSVILSGSASTRTLLA